MTAEDVVDVEGRLSGDSLMPEMYAAGSPSLRRQRIRKEEGAKHRTRRDRWRRVVDNNPRGTEGMEGTRA